MTTHQDVTLRRSQLLSFVLARVALIPIALGIGAFFTVAYTESSFVCEYTGSRKGYDEWWFGVRTGRWYERSALEEFVRHSHPSELEHSWTSYQGNGKTIYGQTIVRGHGRPGEIFRIRSFLSEYAADASPDEMKALYDTMRWGSKAERRALADEVTEEWLLRH